MMKMINWGIFMDKNSISNFSDLFEMFKDVYLVNEGVPFADEMRTLFKTPGKEGNLNHFLNVASATVHVIKYAETKLGESFSTDRFMGFLGFSLYHDLGKTRQDHRHAITGAMMIENAPLATRRDFRNVGIADYDAKLPLIAAIVGFHDVFGMSSTGEAGIVSIGRAVDKLRTVTRNDDELNAAITDLWLLNIADILCSRKDKYILQPWTNNQPGELFDEIDSFFETFKGKKLRTDLVYAREIAFKNLDPVKASELSACERIQCLTREAFSLKIFRDDIPTDVSNMFMEIIESPSTLTTIRNALAAQMGEDYAHVFGTMYQFDYALGMFLKMVDYFAESVVGDEEISPALMTAMLGEWYMVVAGIFAEIYRVKGDVDWNVEFEDVAKNITTDDIKSLFCENGLYAMASTRKSLIRQIFLYK
jgi:hypothetical protein